MGLTKFIIWPRCITKCNFKFTRMAGMTSHWLAWHWAYVACHYLHVPHNSNYFLQEIKKRKVPWKSIATSLPLLAIVTAEVAFCWLWYTALTSIPIYINDVLQFNIKKVRVIQNINNMLKFIIETFKSGQSIISKS